MPLSVTQRIAGTAGCVSEQPSARHYRSVSDRLRKLQREIPADTAANSDIERDIAGFAQKRSTVQFLHLDHWCRRGRGLPFRRFFSFASLPFNRAHLHFRARFLT